jgi:copper chaperone CopZ
MTCAFAVRGALKKYPGVDSVDVSLNKGLATVKLKPGNNVQPQQFWETVRKNGFTPKETRVVVRGQITGEKLNVTGSGQIFDLQADPKLIEEIKKRAGRETTIEGTLTPARDVKAPVPLHVTGIRGDQ